MSRHSMRKNALAVAILSLGFGMGSLAQSAGTSTSTSGMTTPPNTATTTSGTSSKTTLDRTDRKFIEEAAMGGIAEVELANLAKQKAGSDAVKQFASRMAEDHGKANDQLKQTASAKGIDLPTTLDKKHQKELDQLQKLSGADFDRAYMKHMVSDHKKDVSAFEKEAKSAKDSDIKSFASSTLPTLQEHLKLAQSTDDAVKNEKKTASTGTTSTSPTSTSGTGSTEPSSTRPKQ